MITLNQGTDLAIALFTSAAVIVAIYHRSAARKEINAGKQEVLDLIAKAKQTVVGEEQKIAADVKAEIEHLYGGVRDAAVKELTTVRVDFQKALTVSRLRVDNAIQAVEVKAASLIRGAAPVVKDGFQKEVEFHSAVASGLQAGTLPAGGAGATVTEVPPAPAAQPPANHPAS